MSKIDELIKKLCPNGVVCKTIQDICNITRGRVMSKDYIMANQGNYPVYSSQTENNGELGKISTFDFDGEYLTWTTDGANAGSVFYRNGKFSVTNVCGLLEVIDDNIIITKYLYYILSIEAPKYVNAGMGNPKLMSNVMARIKIAVPPLEVQCEIVRVLDDFTLLSAELSAELKARQKQYEYYRNVLLENQNYEIKKFKDTCNMKAGKNISASKISSIKNDSNKFECYGGGGIRGYVENSNKEGEFPIIGRQGALCGNVQYAKGKFYATEHAVVVESKGAYLQRYLFYLLAYMNLNQYKSAGAQPGLSVGNILELEAPVPPISEQRRIVDILDKLDKICTDISEGLPAEIKARQKQYEYYRDKLLTFKELVNEG